MVIKIENPVLARLYSNAFSYSAAKAEAHSRIRKLKSNGRYNDRYIAEESDRLKRECSASKVFALNKIDQLKEEFSSEVLTGDITSRKKIDPHLRDLMTAPVDYRPQEYVALARMYAKDPKDSLNLRMIQKRALQSGFQLTGVPDAEKTVEVFNRLANATGEILRKSDFNSSNDNDPEDLNEIFQELDETLSQSFDVDGIGIIRAGDDDAAISAEIMNDQRKQAKATAGDFERGFEGDKPKSPALEKVGDLMQILGIDDPAVEQSLKINLDSKQLAESLDPYVLRKTADEVRANGNAITADNLLRIANSQLKLNVEFSKDPKEQFSKLSPSTAGDRAKIESVHEARAEQEKAEESK